MGEVGWPPGGNCAYNPYTEGYLCELVHYSQMVVEAHLYAPTGFYNTYPVSESNTATAVFPTVSDPGWWSVQALHYVQVDRYYADCIWPNPWGYCNWNLYEMHYAGTTYEWVDTTYDEAYIPPLPPPCIHHGVPTAGYLSNDASLSYVAIDYYQYLAPGESPDTEDWACESHALELLYSYIAP